MKKLSQRTVQRAFKKMGFVPLIESDEVTYSFIGTYSYQHMSLHLPPPNAYGNIVLRDARWSKNGGVHIDSYYGWPRNLKELHDMIEKIRTTYSELCGIQFLKGYEI